VFVKPPSLEALRERIIRRCSRTSEGEIRRRLAVAAHELRGAPHFEYRIVNRELPKAVARLKEIITHTLHASA